MEFMDLITILLIIALAAASVGFAFIVGLRGGHESEVGTADDSNAVRVWSARADKIAASLAVVSGDAADDATEEEDEEAIKARKREEALARKAARQAKQAEA